MPTRRVRSPNAGFKHARHANATAEGAHGQAMPGGHTGSRAGFVCCKPTGGLRGGLSPRTLALTLALFSPSPSASADSRCRGSLGHAWQHSRLSHAQCLCLCIGPLCYRCLATLEVAPWAATPAPPLVGLYAQLLRLKMRLLPTVSCHVPVHPALVSPGPCGGRRALWSDILQWWMSLMGIGFAKVATSTSTLRLAQATVSPVHMAQAIVSPVTFMLCLIVAVMWVMPMGVGCAKATTSTSTLSSTGATHTQSPYWKAAPRRRHLPLHRCPLARPRLVCPGTVEA